MTSGRLSDGGLERLAEAWTGGSSTAWSAVFNSEELRKLAEQQHSLARATDRAG
jgi:hypothetical protein